MDTDARADCFVCLLSWIVLGAAPAEPEEVEVEVEEEVVSTVVATVVGTVVATVVDRRYSAENRDFCRFRVAETYLGACSGQS